MYEAPRKPEYTQLICLIWQSTCKMLKTIFHRLSFANKALAFARNSELEILTCV